jgi:hypothetical protein
MRHGKKGNMSLFLEDAPPEMNFVQDPVQLTTKVKRNHMLLWIAKSLFGIGLVNQ